MITLMAAVDRKFGIAKDGHIPWDIPMDMGYFRSVSTGEYLIAGGETARAIGRKIGKHMMVLTSGTLPFDGVELVHTSDELLAKMPSDAMGIGGQSIYSLLFPLAGRLLLTHVDGDFACDRFFPNDLSDFELASQSNDLTQNNIRFCFKEYVRKNLALAPRDTMKQIQFPSEAPI